MCTQAQRRGTAKFLSSPVEELAEWDSVKTEAEGSSISRADIITDGIQARRLRYRSTSTTTTTEKLASDDSDANIKTSAKVPVYRVRGRNRTKSNTENEKSVSDVTTAKTNADNNRPIRRKTYQSNKQRTNARNENQSIETSPKSAVPHAHSSRKYPVNNFESGSKSTTTELPPNHQPENPRAAAVSTRKTPTGRRYRIRVVEANALNGNSQPTDSEKKVHSSTSATADVRSSTKFKKTDRDAVIDDEQNYPEHFKALLKSKKSTVASSTQPSGSTRTNAFVPKKHAAAATATSTTSTSTAAGAGAPETTVRPAYKHKKIERPNLKLLFPSLQKSSTTTVDSTTAFETDQTATNEINTEPATDAIDVSSTTLRSRTTVTKQIGGLKFSSKIRNENDELSSLSAFRPRSTPLVFDTLKSTTPPLPANHRFSVSTTMTNGLKWNFCNI